jgi:hypothetical protein
MAVGGGEVAVLFLLLYARIYFLTSANSMLSMARSGFRAL